MVTVEGITVEKKKPLESRPMEWVIQISEAGENCVAFAVSHNMRV